MLSPSAHDDGCNVVPQGDVAALLHAMRAGLRDSPPMPSALRPLCEASCLAEQAVAMSIAAHKNALSELWVTRHICTVLSLQASDEDVRSRMRTSTAAAAMVAERPCVLIR